MDMQKQIDAMAEELAVQRNILGARAMQLAVANAQLRSDLEAAKKRIAELEKPA